MSTLTNEVTLEESQSTEADEIRKYLLSFIQAGQKDSAWFIFFQELVDTILALGAEGYDLAFNTYVQELLDIGRELFDYDGKVLLDELYGEEEM